MQLRANVQDNNTAPNTPKSSFDVGTALLGVRGNLFKDYNEGKNLDYQASFGYSKRNDGSNNSNFNLLDAYLRYHVFSTNGGAEVPQAEPDFGSTIAAIRLGRNHRKIYAPPSALQLHRRIWVYLPVKMV